MGQFIRQFIWSRDLASLIGRAMGTLSLLSLLKFAFGHTLGFPFSLPFTSFLDVYDCLVGYALSALEPAIATVVAWITYWLDLHLTLNPAWKHVTILVGLYFSRSVWIAFGNDLGAFFFRLLEAPLLALACGIASGLVPWTNDGRLSNLLIGFFPIATLFLYGAFNGVFAAVLRKEREIALRPHLDTRWKILLGHVKAAWTRTWIGGVILAVGVEALIHFQSPNPGLTMIAALAMTLAAYFLREGVAQAKRSNGAAWATAYWQMDSTRLGTAMAGVFAWNAISFATDWLLSHLDWSWAHPWLRQLLQLCE